MTYSKVTGKYFYGNGDFQYFEGYITDTWGGGNYYPGQYIYWNSSNHDGFYFWDAFNNTGNYGYYKLDEIINYSGSIYNSSHWRDNGIKVLSYYDSYSDLILIPNESKTYGLGNQSGYIHGYTYSPQYYSNSYAFDFIGLNINDEFWGEKLGFINSSTIKSITDSVNPGEYKFHKFDCYKKNYLHFKLSDFSTDMDFILFKYNNEKKEWESVFEAESNSNKSEEFFKILEPNSYIIAVTNYDSTFKQSYTLEIDGKSFHENTILPNDSRFQEQWSLLNYGQGDGFDNADIYAPGAWKIRSKSPNVVVAIIDSGIDYNHEDLKSNIWTNQDEIINNGIDDDLNGYIDDYLGWDFYNNDNNPHPWSYSNIHGTHVAGIIGAEGNNGLGIAGLTWDVQLMNLKVFSDYQSVKNSYVTDIWEAIRYAADNGADIINLSLGIDIGRLIVNGGYYYQGTFNDFKNIAPSFYNGWYSALKYASDKGCSIIAAAGNEYSNNDNFTCIPADFATEIPGMISVAAASNKGRVSSYSNYGNIISIAAPGGDFNSGKASQILSTTPYNRYEAISGTSMAAPIVSGAVALMIAENPSLSPQEIKEILMTTAYNYKWLEGKVNSSNYLNLYQAINLSQTYTSNKAPTNWNLSTTIFDENIEAGSIVATLSAIDENLSDTHTFSFVDGYKESSGNKFFTINGNQLKIKNVPDYESKKSYTIVLKTTDQSGLSSPDLYITLSVNDINDAPTGVDLNSIVTNFDENISALSTVASFRSLDQDTSDTHTFSFVDGYTQSWGNKHFIIEGNSLKIKDSPDYESISSYEIVVKSTDSDGLNSPAAVFQFTVNDIDDPSDSSDIIKGGDGDDQINALAGSDTITGGIGNDVIDGGEGSDISVYSGNFSDYSITRENNHIKISDQRLGTNDGTDTLSNVEYIQFKDQTVQESKVDKIKTYSGDFSDYMFYNKGNGVYQIKTNSGYDDITGFPLLTFSGETTSSSFKEISAIVDIKGTFDQVTGLNTVSGKMFRLYNAAFKRLPDSDGLKYWIGKYISGENNDREVASSFLISNEFKERYGNNVSNAKYVENLYFNILGRDYDQDGYNYWLGKLNTGEETRYELLLGFAESLENKVLFTEMTGLG